MCRGRPWLTGLLLTSHPTASNLLRALAFSYFLRSCVYQHTVGVLGIQSLLRLRPLHRCQVPLVEVVAKTWKEYLLDRPYQKQTSMVGKE